jgi:hypothetical protein
MDQWEGRRMTTIRTRMGDGHVVEMTVDQIRARRAGRH